MSRRHALLLGAMLSIVATAPTAPPLRHTPPLMPPEASPTPQNRKERRAARSKRSRR